LVADFSAPPDDLGRLFVVEKGGRITILDLATGAPLAAPFLYIAGEVNPAGEQGLLGLAFHPDYATNGLFYLYLSTPSGDAEVRRYQARRPEPRRRSDGAARHRLRLSGDERQSPRQVDRLRSRRHALRRGGRRRHRSGDRSASTPAARQDPALSLLDLREGHCWPLGNDRPARLFCGAPSALVHGASTISASRSRVWAVPCSAAKVGVLSGSE
jgi:hypothetical protein